MTDEPIIFTVFLVFTGAAVLATLALIARQSLLVAYIALGALLGPWGLGLVEHPETVAEIGNIGIIFLLFLLGLNLDPQDLLRSLRRTTIVTFASSTAFAGAGIAIGLGVGFTLVEALIIGGAMTFSSTIIGLKLLPTTVLHHQRMGRVIISVLLLQDLLAIALLLVIGGATGGENPWIQMALVLLKLPLLILVAIACAHYLLLPLIQRFDTFREYVFLLAIGWCVGLAELSFGLGLSREIGAFIAGISLASSPIAFYIAESLRAVRDFFLVLFFFSLGARFNLGMVEDAILPAVLTAGTALLIKPLVFRLLLMQTGETRARAGEIGHRLGQLSEFSLLIAALALSKGVIGELASYTLQLATILTFLVSSYLVVRRYPTPIALTDELRRD
ncbi:cation:proton antiporter [Thiococcus pfennigii]|uniref:cation:proton antiporter domain-containing protein n=1 Tax=Thiococcus pfennigii TaxID=1057 RepID=UPI0019077BCA|nr:cation:proton antiporter [Thiococcus pfennigii]MBK1699642.1 sodium:proton antiporter [Thiococcus pfennigii]